MKLRTKASLFISILLVLIFLGQAVYFQFFLEKALLEPDPLSAGRNCQSAG